MAYPVFLLPADDIMSTAIVEGNAIKILKKTLFPAGMRYAISADGMAACLDKERKLIIYGQLLADGNFAFYKILAFPEMISPKSLAVIKHHIVLGGENNSSFGNDIRSRELVATYNLLSGQFTALEMPFQQGGKCVDDLLLQGDSVIAVDNIVYPKYILTYDFKDPYSPRLTNTFQLPNNGTYETIKKGTISNAYTALISFTYGDGGGGKYINIFKTGNYQDYIRLEQWFGWETRTGKYHWNDILIIDNFLCIAAHEDGIGLFKIEEFPCVGTTINDRSSEVQYADQDNKKVLKVIEVPDQSDTYIIIAQHEGEYYYKLISKTDLLNQYDDFLNDTADDDLDYGYDYNDNRNYSSHDADRDYFDAMTDGQLGSYDDFLGNSDDIDDWAGR